MSGRNSNPWVRQPQTKPAEMEKAYRDFLNNGGKIERVPENFKQSERHSDTAIKIFPNGKN